MGSGVLLDIAGNRFLVSAAHVFDHMTIRENPCFLASRAEAGKPIHLNHVEVITSPVPAVAR